MATFNRFNSFVEALAEKKHDLGGDTLRVMLTNAAPNSSMTVKTDITEIAAGSGYTAGGNEVTGKTSAQTLGTYKLNGVDVVFTASGAMAAFRYAVLYNDTASNDELIGWWDYGSSVSLQTGETFTVDFDGTNGILQIAPAA